MNLNEYVKNIQTNIKKVKCVIALDETAFLRLENEYKSSRWFKQVKVLKLEKYCVDDLIRIYQLNVHEECYPFDEEALRYLASESVGNPKEFKKLLFREMERYEGDEKKGPNNEPKLIKLTDLNTA